jgi:hypothetical protein
MRTYTEAHVELRALRREVLNRLHVQMIVVIVRDQHGVDAREIRELDRRRMHALRSNRHWRDDVGEYGICHQPHAFDLHQDARVAEPYRAQAVGCRRAGRCRRQRNHRNFELRLANLTLAVQAECFRDRAARFLWRRVLESSIDELGRVMHARESLTIEATAEGGELEDAVAREREEGDDADQDLGEFLQAVRTAIVNLRLHESCRLLFPICFRLKLWVYVKVQTCESSARVRK